MKTISTLILVSSAGLLSTTAHAYDCSQLASYVNGSTYATGARVKNLNKAFSCTVGGWCSVGGPYEPGVGWAASNAWAELGACDVGNTSSSAAPSSVSSSSVAPSSVSSSSVAPSSVSSSAAPSSISSISSSSSSVATGICAGINVYPNW